MKRISQSELDALVKETKKNFDKLMALPRAKRRARMKKDMKSYRELKAKVRGEDVESRPVA